MELDPKIYRKKWLAFRLFEQGEVAESAWPFSPKIGAERSFAIRSLQGAEIRYESPNLPASPAPREAVRDPAEALWRLAITSALNLHRERWWQASPVIRKSSGRHDPAAVLQRKSWAHSCFR